MSIRILTDKKMMNALEVMVHSKDNAEFIAEEAKAGGFEKVRVKEQSGTKGTGLFHVLIGTKPGGQVSDIVAFLEAIPDIDYGDDLDSE